jgi:hypothetical protein
MFFVLVKTLNSRTFGGGRTDGNVWNLFFTWNCEMGGLDGLLGGSMGGVTDDGGGCCLSMAVVWPIIWTTGASLVGVGGGETGDEDGREAGQGVEAFEERLRPWAGVAMADEQVVEATEMDETLELDEQSDPQREPDSRRWLSMCDVRAAAVLYPRWQTLHWNGLRVSCVLTWIFRWSLQENLKINSFLNMIAYFKSGKIHHLFILKCKFLLVSSSTIRIR